MGFEMHRVFLAAPVELEAERQVFYEAVGEVNEAEGMPSGILLVPVSLPPNLTDKRVYQGAIESNIRSARYYVQLLQGSWGPPERNFEKDYELASACADRKIFSKQPSDGAMDVPLIEFWSLDELKSKLKALCSEWLTTLRR